jgi:UDPglucose 6-dehydrogenase
VCFLRDTISRRAFAHYFPEDSQLDIAVIGTGYVGLVTGAGLADFGNDVICCDIDPNKIEALNNGRIPIYEPGLDTIVNRNVNEKRLRFTTDLPEAIRRSRAIFIAVGTPPKPDGSADLRYVEDVARTIAQHMNGPKLVITKSTVPIGTGRLIERILDESGNGHKGSVVSNPEFLREGSAIEDFLKPDRVVIGASDEESIGLMKEIYAPLHSLEIPFVVTNVESSELIKYAANGFLATKISFINEVAVMCELLGADVQDVARGIGLDSRIGPKFLQAGPGFGGSCFPKDTSAVADIARQYGYEFEIIEAVLRVNNNIKQRMVRKVVDALGEVRGKTVAILGLAFKPETDDMRDSPTIPLIKGLQELGAMIRAYDPGAIENSKKIFENVKYCGDAYETADGADALVIATEWNEFRALKLERVKKLLKQPLIIDLRNVYDPQRMKAEGFTYISVGRTEDVRVRERV